MCRECFAVEAQPKPGRVFSVAGKRSQEEVWCRADRRSQRPQSGRSVHRRDARGNISVPRMLIGVPAAKQRKHNAALSSGAACRHCGGFNVPEMIRKTADMWSGVSRRLWKSRGGWSINRWDTKRNMSVFRIVESKCLLVSGIEYRIHSRTRWAQCYSNSRITNEVFHPIGFSFLKK